ncbi:Inherit from euNOG: Conserved hypothetical protein (Partial), partial [Seminavis robusta]
NGVMGVSGHVCAFEQNVEEFAKELPKLPRDTTVLRVVKVVRAEIGSEEKRDHNFLVRRSAVWEALVWLKKYNIEYKNITLKESNLDWILGTEDYLDGTDIVTDEDLETEDHGMLDQNSDLGPIPLMTRMNHMMKNDMPVFGLTTESKRTRLSPEDEKVVDALTDSISESSKKKEITLSYPPVSEEAINEFGDTKIFARAYPWLFPGGIGDVKHFPHTMTKWGEYMLLYEDGRFAKDKLFAFFATNYIVRHRNSSSGNWFIKELNKGGPTTLEELQESIENGDTKFTLCG